MSGPWDDQPAGFDCSFSTPLAARISLSAFAAVASVTETEFPAAWRPTIHARADRRGLSRRLALEARPGRSAWRAPSRR